jgi:Mn2+/Fe2+ NRAMP family transporter
MKFLEIFLGILTALGGFVEIGELLFSMNAGAKFHFSLLWVVALGTLGIIVYGEMAGRIAAVAREPVFDVIRDRTPRRLGLTTLFAAVIVGIMTCAAEVGGVALILQLLFDLPYRLYIVFALVFFLLVIWLLPFRWIERVFGLGGLLMLIFMATAVAMKPDWGDVASGLIPQLPAVSSTGEYLSYAYYAVALLSSIMLPYETYFYASGGIEDDWKPSDVPLNRFISAAGFSLGGMLAATLVIVGAQVFELHHIEAELPGTAAFGPILAFGKAGLLLCLLGMFFAFAGATIENCLSVAYNITQFFNWDWGKRRKPREVPRFTGIWIAVIVLASAIIMTGIDPVQVVEYAIVFSVVILPFSYYPVLRTARDRGIMGSHANGRIANALGAVYLVLVTLAAAAAIPLLIITHGGKS